MKQVRLFVELFIVLLIKVVLFTFVSLTIVIGLFVYLHPVAVQSGASSNVGDTSFVLKYTLFEAFGIFCFFAFPEEFVFHFIPLGICMAFDKSRKFWPIVALISAIVFGLMHGNWVNILLQGVAGGIYSIGFAKENKGEMGVVKALLFTIVIHAFYNLILAFYWG